MHWARRLHKLVPAADKVCKNPSRLSRLPYRFRPETGKEQALLFLGERIPNAQLNALLPEEPIYTKKERSAEEVRNYVTQLLIEASIMPDEFMSKRGLASRNQFFFYLGKRMEELNMQQDKKFDIVKRTYDNLYNTTDFPFEEALAAARVHE